MQISTREKILDAADQLFGELGFDATSTNHIAQSSNTNKALINYHFRSKEGLFTAVLDRYFENLSEKLHKAIYGEGTIQDKLKNLIGAYIDFLEINKNYILMVQREIMGGVNRERVTRHMVGIFEGILQVMSEAYPRAAVDRLRLEQVTVSFYGMVITYFTCSEVVKHLFKTDPLSAESIKARKKHLLTMADLVLKTLDD